MTRRTLGRFDVLCLGTNAIIGSGIFALPDDLYRSMGGFSPLAFLLCAVGLVPVALCYAEAAGTTDRTGGPYVYAREAFGPWPGYLVGWMCFANSLFSFAAVATFAAASMGLPRGAGAAGIIVLFTALNYVGTRPGARVIDLFTVGKIAALGVVVVAALGAFDGARFGAPLPSGARGVGQAVFAALFALQGFEVAPVPAGETEDARRAVPVAILGSLGLASVIYVVVQAALVASYAGLGRESATPVADGATAISPLVGRVVAVGAVVSALGFVAGNALGTPRYAFAAAVDGHLPRALSAVHPRFETPHRAIAVTGLIAALLVAAGDYRQLVGMSNVTVAVQYFATCAAVVVLRRRGVRGTFRAPGGMVVPLVGMAASASIVTEGTVRELLAALAALALGVVLGARWRGATSAP